MTEPEALAVLERQLASEEGFLARLRQGDGLDRDAVEQVLAALGALAELWADRAYVPRRALLPLVDMSTPILDCRELNPELADELAQLAADLAFRVEDIVYTQPAGMTEEEATAVIYGQLRGMSGIALRLHHREDLYDLDWADELLTALDVLTVAWRGRDDVPKAVVGPMLEARHLIRGHAGNYARWHEQLERIGDEVSERVRRCLSD